MNTKISKKFYFQSGVHYNGVFVINNYDIELFMDVNTDDMREQNIAIDRINYLFTLCLDNCVFVAEEDIDARKLYAKAGMSVCSLPEEPFDQIIGAVLLTKLNAITEDKLIITDVKISSKICDDVIFYISYEEDFGLLVNKNKWWNENQPNISTADKKSTKEKIVDLKKDSIDWNTLGLGWKEETKKGEIVFIPAAK
jgi:hypothetical protein